MHSKQKRMRVPTEEVLLFGLPPSKLLHSVPLSMQMTLSLIAGPDPFMASRQVVGYTGVPWVKFRLPPTVRDFIQNLDV